MNIHILYSFIFILLFTGCRSKSNSFEKINVHEIDSLAQDGIDKYSSEPLEAIKDFYQAGVGYEDIDSFKQAGIMFLNVAGIYEEHTDHIDSAMMYAHRSLENFQFAKDSMQIANLNKYYGYLLGMNGHIDEGTAYISRAIHFYQRVEFEEGVAVSQFNLARLAFLQKEYSKSDSLLNEAMNVWKRKNNISRLFLINLAKLEIAIESQNMGLISSIVQECDSIVMMGRLPEQSLKQYSKIKARI